MQYMHACPTRIAGLDEPLTLTKTHAVRPVSGKSRVLDPTRETIWQDSMELNPMHLGDRHAAAAHTIFHTHTQIVVSCLHIMAYL